MSAVINRRQLLGGDLRGRLGVRPPWSLPEEAFLETCTRCGDCVAVCPEKVIVTGSGGYPQMDFAAGGCEFCGDCVAVCKAKALVSDESGEDVPAWSLKASIAQHCLSLNGVVCRSCAEACWERAITFKLAVGGRAIPLLDLGQCSGCGWCYGVCPTNAVVMFRPEQTDVQPQLQGVTD